MGERRLASAISYLTLLSVVITQCVIAFPTLHAQTQTFERLMYMTNNDIILTYNITRNVKITNVNGLPMSYSVGQEYLVRIKAINGTHVVVQGFRFPGSTIHLTLSSSEWVGIGGLIYWILSNYTDFITKNALLEYNVTLVRSSAVNFVNTVFLLPLLREVTAGACSRVPIANTYIDGFTVVVSTSLGNGNAYYDCKYGILFKAYIAKTTYQRLGNATYLIEDSINLELHKANTEILNEIVVREQAWGFYEALIYVIPAISIAAVTTSILLFLRFRRKTRGSPQRVMGEGVEGGSEANNG